MYDAVLSFDFVGCLGEKGAWGLLAHNVSLAIGRDELVGRVGLAKAELWRKKMVNWMVQTGGAG
jgi:hypothetical protein